MNANDLDHSGPILPGSALARTLDDYCVPPLGAGFADRVLAAAETRAPPLPDLRRAPGGGRGWRIGRRIAVATLGFGALATAAAATGLLERFDIPVPSPETVWASLTGKEAAAASTTAASKPDAAAPTALVRVAIDDPIDTPEELGEAFRRIDEVRQGRIETRRQIIDQRIDSAIERRRAAGLPVPDAEQEARLRARIGEAQARRESIAADRIAAKREELRQRVEGGEALTRENFLPNRAPGTDAQARTPRLRDLSPQERRELLRELPPEQRGALLEELRQRRDQRRAIQPGSQPAITPEATPSVPTEQIEADPAQQAVPQP